MMARNETKKTAKKSAKKTTAAKKTTGKTASKAGIARTSSADKSGRKKASAGSASQKIEAKIRSLNDWRGERLAEIRTLIHQVDPEVIEDWKWMGTPVWSNEGMYVLANPHKDKVKITFHHGAHLRDAKKLFNNGFDGNKWRAIDLYEGDKINKTAFKALLREAIAYNKTHAVPKSKGSRV
jgi:hypothetical protein